MTDPDLTRRRAVTGAVVGGLSLPVLAACGGSSSSTATQQPGGTSPAGGGKPSKGGGGGAPANALVALAQVPVGGGVILRNANIVVTQPTQGSVNGFSATCTHQGCQLATVAAGTINCACHGSQFSITDGANVTGPMGSPAGSVAPLGKVPVKVEGKDVVQG